MTRPFDEKNVAYRNAFIVRFSQEKDQSGWRAWVQHVPTGQAVLVQSLGELVAFFERWTGELTDEARKGLR